MTRVIVRACLYGNLVQRFGEATEKNDRDFGQIRVCLQLGTHFKAVHLWHVNVQQNQVRRVAPGRL
jgi:hypothetical protein